MARYVTSLPRIWRYGAEQVARPDGLKQPSFGTPSLGDVPLLRTQDDEALPTTSVR